MRQIMISFSLLLAVVMMNAALSIEAVLSLSLARDERNDSLFAQRQKLNNRFLDEDLIDPSQDLPDNSGNSSPYPLGTDVWWKFDGEWCVVSPKRFCSYF
jgi:hypothetical protein